MAAESPESQDFEAAWHALLHDLRGCIGGLKATLDLRDAGAGLEARDAARLDTGVREGLALLEIARALVSGPWPEGGLEPASVWAKGVETDLGALAAAYRGKASLLISGEGPWPGALLRSFTLSAARLVLPQALPDPLALEAEARPDAWILRFRPVLAPPLALQAAGGPRDLHGLWVKAVAKRCRMEVAHEGDCLMLRIPREPEGLPPVE